VELTAEQQAEADAKAKADAEAADAKAKADAAAAAEKAKEVKFSQADLDRIAGESRGAGRAAAEKDLLEKLGVTDLDAAAAVLKAAADAEEANKTETQRLAEELTREKARADENAQAALRVVTTSELKGALRDAGINPDRLDAAMRLADVASLKVEGTTVTGIPEVIESVRTTSPEWFGSVHGAPDAQGGGGGSVDFRTASRDQVAKELLATHGIRL
jgi:hypothetical protein